MIDFPKCKKHRDNAGVWHEFPYEYIWPYHNAKGEITHAVGRCYNTILQKKETPPLTLHDGKWRCKAPLQPYPLFNLHLLSQARVIVIVEGEKCADLLQTAFKSDPRIAVMCWMGGANAVYKSDWTVITGKTVIIWPDNDAPGTVAAMQVAGLLQAANPVVKITELTPDKPEGWDCADAIADGWTPAQLFQFIKNSKPVTDATEPPAPEPEQPPIIEPETVPEYFDEIPKTDCAPFKILGFDRDVYYYLPTKTRQVIGFTISSHSKNSLLTLSPNLTYWESMYGGGKGGVNWTHATASLFRAAQTKGVFKTDRIRGIGAWIDKQDIVINYGTNLNVNGQIKQTADVESAYIYEQSVEILDTIAEPLHNSVSSQFLELMKNLHWESPLHAYYLAGWCVIAPICGALNWRPHLWLTGIASAGKTYVLKNIVKPMIDPWVLYVQSNTTESGLRQTLACDALPIIFDEIEGESTQAQNRIQTILELARQASSEADGAIIKGSTSGNAIAYRIRSMFMFSSISVTMAQQADMSRVTILTLVDPVTQMGMDAQYKADHFKGFSEAVLDTVTPEKCAMLRARTIKLIPVIRANAKVFSVAAAELLGSTRAGDQYGTLLAGAYSLISDKIISIENARAWIGQNDFTEEKNTNTASDSRRCLDAILQHVIRIKDINISISEMLADVKINYGGGESLFDRELRRMGIKFENIAGEKFIVISNTHKTVATILRETPWPKQWGRIIKRISGCKESNCVRFSDGVRTPAVFIPWEHVFDEVEIGMGV